MKTLFLSALLALSAPAFAQGGNAADEEMPALSAPATAPAAGPAAKAPEAGTTIVGDNNESPIGLYITPWRNAAPERGIDRPARLLQDQALPIDADVFSRQVQYYDLLGAAAKKQGMPP